MYNKLHILSNDSNNYIVLVRLNILDVNLLREHKRLYMHQTTPDRQLKKILIVEDEGDMCLLLNIMLKKETVELEHVRTLAAAKQYLVTDTPSLIMLDNKLPDGLGLDFINFLRSSYPDIKILMISGYHAATVKDLALFSGADGFLEKPFTKEQVYESVQALLN